MVELRVSGKTLWKAAIVGGIAVPLGIVLWRGAIYGGFAHPNAQSGPQGPPLYIYGLEGMGRPEQQYPGTANVKNLF